jgi:hypothetical protein
MGSICINNTKENFMKICPKCGAEHSKPGRFCSRSCGNSRERPQELRDRLSLANKGRPGHRKLKGREFVPRYDKSCLECGCLFRTTNKEQKYCSAACANLNSGGYRAGSGRAKTGYYKGIYCGSTYELVWVIYNIDHNVSFTRFEGCLKNDELTYYPDFLLADGKTIVEIKGYEKQESVDKKTALAVSFGYTVIVLRKEQLEKEFTYVSEKYSSDYKTLYDGYQPKYTYVCGYCSNEFSRDKELKTDVVFCSRKCCGKGHKGRVKNVPFI